MRYPSFVEDFFRFYPCPCIVDPATFFDEIGIILKYDTPQLATE
jgi:hypothetical protein